MFVHLPILRNLFVDNVPESWDGTSESDKSNNTANSAPDKLLGKWMNIDLPNQIFKQNHYKINFKTVSIFHSHYLYTSRRFITYLVIKTGFLHVRYIILYISCIMLQSWYWSFRTNTIPYRTPFGTPLFFPLQNYII